MFEGFVRYVSNLFGNQTIPCMKEMLKLIQPDFDEGMYHKPGSFIVADWNYEIGENANVRMLRHKGKGIVHFIPLPGVLLQVAFSAWSTSRSREVHCVILCSR